MMLHRGPCVSLWSIIVFLLCSSLLSKLIQNLKERHKGRELVDMKDGCTDWMVDANRPATVSEIIRGDKRASKESKHKEMYLTTSAFDCNIFNLLSKGYNTCKQHIQWMTAGSLLGLFLPLWNWMQMNLAWSATTLLTLLRSGKGNDKMCRNWWYCSML